MKQKLTLSEEYQRLCGLLCDGLLQLDQIEKDYLASFPAAFSQGLFSSVTIDKKLLLADYGNYISASLSLLDRLEQTSCKISELMLCADAALDGDTVCRLDGLLTQYQSFLAERRIFIQKAEVFFATPEKQLDPLPLFQCIKTLRAATLRFLGACS